MRGSSHFLCCCKESNQRKQLWAQRCQDVTTFESFRVARPLECPPLWVGRIGTRTHCVLAPLNGVVRPSSIRPRCAPTRGSIQPDPTQRIAFTSLRRTLSALRCAFGACLTTCKPYVGHVVPRRMNDCLTTPFNSEMTQWVRVPSPVAS